MWHTLICFISLKLNCTEVFFKHVGLQSISSTLWFFSYLSIISHETLESINFLCAALLLIQKDWKRHRLDKDTKVQGQKLTKFDFPAEIFTWTFQHLASASKNAQRPRLENQRKTSKGIDLVRWNLQRPITAVSSNPLMLCWDQILTREAQHQCVLLSVKETLLWSKVHVTLPVFYYV